MGTLGDAAPALERNKKFIDDVRSRFFVRIQPAQRPGSASAATRPFERGTAGVALRFIPHVIRTIAELNLPPVRSSNSATRKQGFFLVVGPAGAGQDHNARAALIEKINQERAAHIITIEDLIEYLFENKQSPIERSARSPRRYQKFPALRDTCDADVLMIGEMRDPLTMATAVTAAETGHLVFSTLHTNSASQTIDRIIDSFPANQQEQIRIQLAGSLAGIFSQRLIPRISGGLIPAYELLLTNNAVQNLIREKRTHEIQTVIETGADEGMIDMNRCLADLVRARPNHDRKRLLQPAGTPKRSSGCYNYNIWLNLNTKHSTLRASRHGGNG